MNARDCELAFHRNKESGWIGIKFVGKELKPKGLIFHNKDNSEKSCWISLDALKRVNDEKMLPILRSDVESYIKLFSCEDLRISLIDKTGMNYYVLHKDKILNSDDICGSFAVDADEKTLILQGIKDFYNSILNRTTAICL